LQQDFSASAFVACVTPTAPGVNDATFASEPEPTTHMIELKVTGIAKAARKTRSRPAGRGYPRKRGQKNGPR